MSGWIRISIETLLVVALVSLTVALYRSEEKKVYEPGTWDCEEVRFPKFKDGQVFRSGECVLWRKVIDASQYEVEP